MLYNARRINFEPEFRLPNYTVAQLWRQEEDRLLNNKGQFFVHVSETTPYVKELVRKAQDLNLTVSGDGTAPVGKKLGDITNVRKGDQITFGSSDRFDVNWVARDGYTCSKGFAPVYDIVKDWNKIEKALKQFADQKKKLNTVNGENIQFHARFMMVDGRVVPYNRQEIAVLVPVETLRDIMFQYDILTVKVIRNY